MLLIIRTVVKLLLGAAYGMKVDSLEDEVSLSHLIGDIAFSLVIVCGENRQEYS
jgi:hypothetical protein